MPKYKHRPPEAVQELCRRLRNEGREVTPDQVLEWADDHAAKLNTLPCTHGVPRWDSIRVVGCALIDSDAWEAVLRMFPLTVPS